MTTLAKNALTLLFEQGDVPTGSNYADLIDSQVNLAETAAQVMQGPLIPTELITARVSATFGRFTSSVEIQGNTSVARLFISTSIHTSALDMKNGLITNVGKISGSAANFSADVSAGIVYSTNGVISGTGIVSAAGTTQGAAAILTNVVNRGKGVADGVTTGYAPLANKPGLVQYLYNEGPSANLWPPTGGTINGLAANAAFALATSAMVTIIHLTASAYAVK